MAEELDAETIAFAHQMFDLARSGASGERAARARPGRRRHRPPRTTGAAGAHAAGGAALLATLTDDRAGARPRSPVPTTVSAAGSSTGPRPRPGLLLADMGRAARKAAHRLLATALSPPAYAQAMAVIALEEVLDRREGWRRGRHSEDYRVIVFGDAGRRPVGVALRGPPPVGHA